jgi:hypothetical protein
VYYVGFNRCKHETPIGCTPSFGGFTEEQSSVNQHPRVRKLIAQRDKWKRRFKGKATEQPVYKSLGAEISRERQRQRYALLKEIRDRWDQKQPVIDVERQLAGEKFSEDVKATLELSDDIPPEQKRLIKTIMTLPGTTLEEEVCRRNAAINTVAAYCKFEEGGARGASRKRPSTRVARPIKTEGATQPVAADPDEQALNEAMLSVFQEKRPKICFICIECNWILIQTPDWSGYCIGNDRSWITSNGNKVL